jgi:hypothetical protein
MAFAENSKIDATTLTVIGYHEITDTKNALIPQYAVTTQQFTSTSIGYKKMDSILLRLIS